MCINDTPTLWFMDLCLGSGSVLGHWIALVTFKNSIQKSTVIWYSLLFIYPKIVYFFFFFSSFSSSPPFSSAPYTPFTIRLSFCCPPFTFHHLISDYLFYIVLSSPVFSSCCNSVHLIPSPDWFLCLSIFSSNGTRAASLPVASGAASVYILMMRLQTGTSRKSRVRVTPKWAVVHSGRILQLLSVL